MLNISIAHLHLVGISPLSQSRQHSEPKKEGEDYNEYDQRTWRSKLNTEMRDGHITVTLPSHGIQQALAAAAKYSKRKIEGARGATWTAKFMAGIAILEDVALNIDPAQVDCVTISANADGVRGSGKRVPRIYPVMRSWEAKFDVHILDPVITEDIFHDMVETSGMFVGFGRFRPERGGTNGRFRLESLSWDDNRQDVAKKPLSRKLAA